MAIELGFLDWVYLVGSITAFVLFILKIYDYWKNRVVLEIEVKQKYFTITNEESTRDVAETSVVLDVDVKNKGYQPTSISEVILKSDDKKFTNLEMTNNLENLGRGAFHRYFSKVRLEPNDREKFTISGGLYGSLGDIRQLRICLIFKTTYKDIKKELTLIRNNE